MTLGPLGSRKSSTPTTARCHDCWSLLRKCPRQTCAGERSGHRLISVNEPADKTATATPSKIDKVISAIYPARYLCLHQRSCLAGALIVALKLRATGWRRARAGAAL
jgi:hypothetical protein